MPGLRQSEQRHLEILAASPATGVPIEIDVYDGGNPSTMLATLEAARNVVVQPQLSEVGAGTFVINRYDRKATDAILASGNLVRVKVGGIYREAFWIEEPALVEASLNEAAGEDRTIRGRGALACLERGIVYPPIWPVAAALFRSASASDNNGGATSIYVSKPAGAVVGDVTIVAVACTGEVPSPPAGWALIRDTTNGTLRQTIFGKRLVAGEPSSWRWTWGASTAAVGSAVAIRNATADFTLYTSSEATGNGRNVGLPSVSVGLVDGVLLGFAALALETAVVEPDGWTELTDHSDTLATEVSLLPNPVLGDSGDAVARADTPGDWIGMQLFIPSTASNDAAFSGATFGTILATLLEEAQSRGAIPDVSWDFTGEADSLGNLWPDTHEISFHVGTTLLDVWRALVALGLEGWMGPDLRLRAFVDASRHFESTVILRKGHHITGDVERTAHDAALRTRFLAEGAGGRIIEIADPAAETTARIGRREGYVAMSTSDNATTLQRAGEEALTASQLESNALELDVAHGSRATGHYEPWVDYRPGDWISVDSDGDGTAEAHRVVGMEIRQVEAGDFAVNLDLNSVPLDLLLRMSRRLAEASGSGSGTLGGGGSSSGPASSKVAVVASDVAGYLWDKIEAGAGVTKTLSGAETARRVRLTAAGVVHPNLATHDALGLATDAELAAHAGAADPHTVYQRESEKGAANGYASLGAGGRVPIAQLASGTPDGNKYVRDDGTLAAPAGGMTNPMTTLDDVIVGGTAGAPARLAKGSDGQVLTVDPSTHHLVWATPAAATGDVATDTIWDAKGDLAVGSGANTAGRLAVGGTNGHVLTVDSGETLGVKWAAAAAGGGPSAYGDAVLAIPGVYFYYPCQETSGSYAGDMSGTGRTGIITSSGVTLNVGSGPVTGETLAFTLDGSNGGIYVPDFYGYFGAWTFSAWFKTTATGRRHLFGQRPGVPSLCMGATGGGYGGDGKVRCFLDDGGTDYGIHTNSTYHDGSWHHLAATWKTNPIGSAVAAGDFAIYIDGSAAATSNGLTGSPTSPRLATGQYTWIGKDYGTNSNLWNGSLTHIAAWTRALTSSEVSTLYAAA